MKKLLVGLLMILFPLNVLGSEYKEQGVTINIDNTDWYVFTRDNIKDNKELEDLGVSEEYMKETFENNHLYLEAILFDDKEDLLIDFLLAAKSVEVPYNLNVASKSNIKKFAEGLMELSKSKEYKIFNVNDYVFIKIAYQDQGLYLQDYYTVMNGKTYTFKLQRYDKIDEKTEKMFEDLLSTVKFDNIEKYTKKPEGILKKAARNATHGAIEGGIIGLLVGIGVAISNKLKKNKKEANK